MTIKEFEDLRDVYEELFGFTPIEWDLNDPATKVYTDEEE